MNSRFPSSRTPSSRPYILAAAGADIVIEPPIAQAQAEALIPGIVVKTNVTIVAPIAEAEAVGFEPQVVVLPNIIIPAPIAEATAQAFEPEIVITSNTIIVAPIAEAIAEAFVPEIIASLNVIVEPPAAEAVAECLQPYIIVRSQKGTALIFKGVYLNLVAIPGTKIIVTNIIRPLTEEKTKHKIEIPNRPGSWDFECGVQRDYKIVVEIVIVGETPELVVECSKIVESYLEGKGYVKFTDDPTEHVGQIYQGVSLYSSTTEGIGWATLVFECDVA